MIDGLTVRAATTADAAAIADIYAPYVLETVVSFEEIPPTAAEFEARMLATPRLPWLVAVRGDVGGRLLLRLAAQDPGLLPVVGRRLGVRRAERARPRRRPAALRRVTAARARRSATSACSPASPCRTTRAWAFTKRSDSRQSASIETSASSTTNGGTSGGGSSPSPIRPINQPSQRRGYRPTSLEVQAD